MRKCLKNTPVTVTVHHASPLQGWATGTSGSVGAVTEATVRLKKSSSRRNVCRRVVWILNRDVRVRLRGQLGQMERVSGPAHPEEVHPSDILKRACGLQPYYRKPPANVMTRTQRQHEPNEQEQESKSHPHVARSHILIEHQFGSCRSVPCTVLDGHSPLRGKNCIRTPSGFLACKIARPTGSSESKRRGWLQTVVSLSVTRI